MKWIIKDWAGNTIQFSKLIHKSEYKETWNGCSEFDSFEDAWEFLFEMFPDDEEKPRDEQDLQEYYVTPKD